MATPQTIRDRFASDPQLPISRITPDPFHYFRRVTYITYGQAVYSSLANAVDSVTVEELVIDQELRDACLRAYLILKGNTTDLSDTTNNKISKVGKISPPL